MMRRLYCTCDKVRPKVYKNERSYYQHVRYKHNGFTLPNTPKIDIIKKNQLKK